MKNENACRRNIGFTMVEIVFAFAMVSGTIAVLMNFFMGTQRQAVGSEAKLNATLAAQMVVERIRSQVTLNPAWFRQLGGTGTWTSSGTVVDPAAAATGAGSALSPFFEHLFVLNGGDLYDPANRVSMPKPAGPPPADLASNPTDARRRSLIDSFRDFRVDVRSEDDVDLEPSTPAPALRELIKKVTVTVSRGSVIAAKGSDSGAVTLVTRIVTPQESLSNSALAKLNENFESFDVALLHEEFFAYPGVRESAFFSEEYLGQYHTLLADCYIILGTVGTEKFIVSGGEPGFGQVVMDRPAGEPPPKSLDAWILELRTPQYYQHAVFKRQVAKLERMRAGTIFDSFKKLQPALKHLSDGHKELEPKIDALTQMLKDTEQKLLTLNSETLDTIKEYKDAEKEKKSAEGALANKDTLMARADLFISQAATMKTSAEQILADAAALAASGTAQSIVDAKKAEGERKLEEAKKKKEDGEKLKKELEKAEVEMNATIAEETAKMQSAMAKLQNRLGSFATTLSEQSEELFARLQTVIVVKFLADFFANKPYLDLVDRVKLYPGKFDESMRGMYNSLKESHAQPEGPTPHERMLNALELVEAGKVRMLMGDAPDAALLTELKAIGDRQALRMRELSRYLKENEIHDINALQARNDRFVTKWRVMRDLGNGANPLNQYESVVKLYREGGKIREFLDVYTRVTKEIQLNSNSLLAQFNRQIQGVRGQLAYIGNATAEEILRAMGGVDTP
jgi:type II secretory pathway pseudopilin PulG